jgi:hypothetical protein
LVSDMMRNWVADRLRWISDVIGIRQAVPLAFHNEAETRSLDLAGWDWGRRDWQPHYDRILKQHESVWSLIALGRCGPTDYGLRFERRVHGYLTGTPNSNHRILRTCRVSHESMKYVPCMPRLWRLSSLNSPTYMKSRSHEQDHHLWRQEQRGLKPFGARFISRKCGVECGGDRSSEAEIW